ncbi:hypothetical protein Rs2_42193 [Raphanus sativus]|uniref:Uncharacterized protein LOC108823532 n=1 Tax=Raphanus sativus TaxID=3726 RepID=A0A6J0KYP4_RAPSA|nr:uncharacterized protein LOC108823532 [Raphanus sativus]XP_056849452.1 uncharacterized protein LOC130499426 [Raphanus sativus]XP_056849492.1 uncharacterized protein LOC130499440 [Raphanus sativus]KAJ4877175.1 hypothetical protein Rs2_42193 [Raphanus sativus]
MILMLSYSPAIISAVKYQSSSPFNTRRLSQSIISISRNKSFFLHLTETKEKRRRRENGRVSIVCDAGGMFPVDPWAPTIDSQSIASQLFAVSLFPYIGFLYFLTKSKTAPKLTLFGFYFLLAFVGATIPAGIYAKVHYGTSLSNVDWLHGGAESLLALTNLFIVLGLRQALRKSEDSDEDTPTTTSQQEQEKSSV